MNNANPFLHSVVDIMIPLLLAASGGLFTELGGMLNIALEGLLLTGAFFAVVAVHYTGSLALGILGAVLGSMLLAAILGGATLRLRSNVFITGLAANLFASGVTVVLSQKFFGTRGVVVLRKIPDIRGLNVSLFRNIPVIGDVFFGHTFYVYIGALILLASWLALYKTPFGFRLRACGKHSPALVSLGLRPDACRFAAFLASGFACGLGGSFLSLNLGAFVPNISAGKGWIALVVIFLGGRKPQGILLAVFVFGLADAFSNYAQEFFNGPADFVLAFPYLLTLLVMVGVSIAAKRNTRVS
ncbi:MAG: ABC transporter permease [Treponema sp.]|nr:ABC transporter permease [Treponema sp.]